MKSKIWIGDMSEADKALAFKAVQKIDNFYSNKSLSKNEYVGFFIEGSDITNLTNLRDKSYHYDGDGESTEITLQQLLKLAGMEENMSFTKADLVAGKHVFKTREGDYNLVIDTQNGLGAINLTGQEYFGNLQDYQENLTYKNHVDLDIMEVYEIRYPDIFGCLKEKLKPIWTRPEKSQSQIQFEKLQQQIAELQAQANKLQATL